MTFRPTLEAQLDGVGSSVRGYRAREFAEQVTGRPPVWIARVRAWSLQERHARDVCALAESAGHDVVIVGPRSWSMSGASPDDEADQTQVSPGEYPDPGRGLW